MYEAAKYGLMPFMAEKTSATESSVELVEGVDVEGTATGVAVQIAACRFKKSMIPNSAMHENIIHTKSISYNLDP